MVHYRAINHDRKFIAFFSPKCGSTTIKRWFLDSLYDQEMATSRNFNKALVARSNVKHYGYRKILFIRDPLARLVSFFCHFVIRDQLNWCFADDARAILLIDRTFSEFIHLLKKLVNEGSQPQHHLKLQITGIEGETFDHVYLMEDFHQNIADLNRLLSIDANETTMHNETPYGRNFLPEAFDLTPSRLRKLGIPNKESFWNDELIAIATEIYQPDMELHQSASSGEPLSVPGDKTLRSNPTPRHGEELPRIPPIESPYIEKSLSQQHGPSIKEESSQGAAQYFLEHRHEYMGDSSRDKLIERLSLHIIPVSGNVQQLYADIGCCIGNMIPTMRSLMDDNSVLVCFEPNPANISFLRGSRRAKDIILYECALSDHAGTGILSTIENSRENQAGYTLASLRGSGVQIEEVQLRTFDQVVDELDFRELIIPLVKIDTEGHEWEVINGMKKHLDRTRYIVFEASDCLDDVRGPGIENPLKKIVDLLAEHNFTTYKIGSQRLIKLSGKAWHDDYEAVKFHSNCLALKADDPIIKKICDGDGFFLDRPGKL